MPRLPASTGSIANAEFDELVSFIQGHFSDGLALVIGSGLSAAEGMPGMPEVADYLSRRADTLHGEDAIRWSLVKSALDAGEGLEAALLSHAPTEALEAWIAQRMAELLMPRERDIISAVIKGENTLRLTTFLAKILMPPTGLPILTPNYDRLIEVACEMAGIHADTTAIGQYAGAFDHTRSFMGSCRGIITRGKTTVLEYFPRAIILKPHGSFDWYRVGNDARRCSLDLAADRLIISPGLNKYRAGYDTPFDKHRDLANDHIERAARLLVVGYGFNDDHLQTHLVRRIREGAPTLILNRAASPYVATLANESPLCYCLSDLQGSAGVAVVKKGHRFEYRGHDLWDLAVLAKELLT